MASVSHTTHAAMALRHPFRHIYQIVPRPSRAFASDGSKGARSDCAGTRRPPCPPCEQQPRPCCRKDRPPQQYRLEVSCRPPPVGKRPPCPPSTPSCSATCHNYTTHASSKDGCGCLGGGAQDLVEHRLHEAWEQRRQDYLKSVKEEAEKPRPTLTPIDMNNIPDTGEVQTANAACKGVAVNSCPGEGVYASDGHGYHRDPPPAPRTPPLPRIIPRGHSDNNQCEPRRGNYLNPCDHRPPVTVVVIRDPPNPNDKSIDNLKKNESMGSTCSKKPSSSGMTAGGNSWCKNPPPEASAPKCKEPSFIEKLKRRSCGPPPCTPANQPKRSMHTTAVMNVGRLCGSTEKKMEAKVNEDYKKLGAYLEEKKKLKESGRGRNLPIDVCESVPKQRSFVAQVSIQEVNPSCCKPLKDCQPSSEEPQKDTICMMKFSPDYIFQNLKGETNKLVQYKTSYSKINYEHTKDIDDIYIDLQYAKDCSSLTKQLVWIYGHLINTVGTLKNIHDPSDINRNVIENNMIFSSLCNIFILCNSNNNNKSSQCSSRNKTTPSDVKKTKKNCESNDKPRRQSPPRCIISSSTSQKSVHRSSKDSSKNNNKPTCPNPPTTPKCGCVPKKDGTNNSRSECSQKEAIMGTITNSCKALLKKLFDKKSKPSSTKITSLDYMPSQNKHCGTPFEAFST